MKKIEPRTGKIGRADHLTLNRETYRRRRNCKIIPDGMNDKPPSEVGVANFVSLKFYSDSISDMFTRIIHKIAVCTVFFNSLSAVQRPALSDPL